MSVEDKAIAFTRPQTVGQFRAMLPERAPLPWKEDVNGRVSDADGAGVREPIADLSDGDNYLIAAHIVLAVNTCAGYEFDGEQWNKIL